MKIVRGVIGRSEIVLKPVVADFVQKTRSKTIEEANGGTCDGQSSENETCNTNNCPGKLIFVA